MSEQPPPNFYRVQHNGPFTHYDDEGFSAQASYIMDWCQWVNKEKFESHLGWNANPVEPTPYISLFDNLADAQKHADFHVKQGRHGVFIAKVVPSALTLSSWLIRFSNGNINLPVWKAADHHTFISTSAIGRYLRVSLEISQASEWFAVDVIPANMITVIWKQAEKKKMGDAFGSEGC
jgi:hypothetical protein